MYLEAWKISPGISFFLFFHPRRIELGSEMREGKEEERPREYTHTHISVHGRGRDFTTRKKRRFREP